MDAFGGRNIQRTKIGTRSGLPSRLNHRRFTGNENGFRVLNVKQNITATNLA